MTRRRSGWPLLLLALVPWVIVGALLLLTAQEAHGATRPPRPYFGMAFNYVARGDFPQAPVGTIRLWDTGTSWAELNPSRGTFRWATLDAAVANARAHRAQVLLVLGQTPAWARGDGQWPADLTTWRAYVHRVAARYAGRIGAYETWNEADTPTYSGIGPARMARLQRAAWREVKAVDPHATVTGPSVTLRTGTGPRYLAAFAAAGGFRWAQAVNVHAYPEPDAGPARAVALTVAARDSLGVQLPVWVTEINYGMPWGGGTPRVMGTDAQARYVARTYRLMWAAGVRRVCWYNWAPVGLFSVGLAAGWNSGVPNTVGLAYADTFTAMRNGG